MLVKFKAPYIEKFKQSWPCHGLPDNLRSIAFDFETNGDLVSIDARGPKGKYLDSAEFDGPALLALSNAAQTYVVDNDSAP